MKFYRSIDRDKPVSLGDRLSRLLTFELRAQFSIESGVDAYFAFVLFGHGVGVGFTRGMPHIVGGVYVELDALTERVHLLAGFESDWYHDYLNRGRVIMDGPVTVEQAGAGVVVRSDDGEIILGGACIDGCCTHGDVAECHDAPQHTTLGDLTVDRQALAGLADDPNPQYILAPDADPANESNYAPKPCGIARHQEIGCDAGCKGRV